jgi:hypothetical protein
MTHRVVCLVLVQVSGSNIDYLTLTTIWLTATFFSSSQDIRYSSEISSVSSEEFQNTSLLTCVLHATSTIKYICSQVNSVTNVDRHRLLKQMFPGSVAPHNVHSFSQES